MRIVLPTNINADGFMPFLSCLSLAEDADEVEIDFSPLRRVSPAALAAMACTVSRWRKEKQAVSFSGLTECAITGYLQRMDLLDVCGVDLPETFKKHDASGRFVPLRQVEHRVDEMGHAMAACVAPGGDDYGHPMGALYDFAYYVLTETANNVRQHSGGLGFAIAQVTQAEGMVRLAIADNGRGIRRSFQDAGFPWSTALDDVGALSKALEAKVSSKGTPTNEGVGLTLIAGLAGLSEAHLLLLSGRGRLWISPGGQIDTGRLPDGTSYQGTLIAVTLKQSKVRDFATLLTRAKVAAGLLQDRGIQGIFKP